MIAEMFRAAECLRCKSKGREVQLVCSVGNVLRISCVFIAALTIVLPPCRVWHQCCHCKAKFLKFV